MDELAKKRQLKAERNSASDMAQKLYEYHQAAIDGDFEWDGGTPKGVVIIPVYGDGAECDWGGNLTRADLMAARQAIDDVLHPERPEIRRQNEEYDRKRIQEYERTHPYKCGHERCSQMFKTQGAKTRHERHTCWYRPQANEAK